MMFSPKTITADPVQWAKLTKFAVDCNLKTTTVSGTPFDKYSTNGIYGVLQSPSQFTGPGPSVHNPILQYIEEISADLWCAMTGVNLSDSHCPAVWQANGMLEGDQSTCWHAAYDGLYGSGAAAEALGNPSGGSDSNADSTTASGEASGGAVDGLGTTASPNGSMQKCVQIPMAKARLINAVSCGP